jgi:putative transposase
MQQQGIRARTSGSYQALLAQRGIQVSMSAQGIAMAMPRWSRSSVRSKASGQTGILLRPERWAQLSIFEYIEVFSTRQRRHSTLGYLSPVSYEQQLNG